MSSVIKTRILLENKADKQRGEEMAIDLPVRECVADMVFDLGEVSTIIQSFEGTSDDTLNENQATVYLPGGAFTIETPYAEIVPKWLALFADEVEVNKPLDIGAATMRLAEVLEEDRNKQKHEEDSSSLYYGWQSNIAVAFFDEYDRYRRMNLPKHLHDMPETERIAMHLIANAGAKRFLNMFINSVKPPSNERQG